MAKKIAKQETTIEVFNSPQELPGLKTKLRIAYVKNTGDGSSAWYIWSPTGWQKQTVADLQSKFPKRYDLSSQVNGTRTKFTLPSAAITDTLQVILCGLTLAAGASEENKDYLILSNTLIEFHEAPPLGANLLTYFVQE